MGSYEDTPTNPAGEETSSLAARRAKLRGSLSNPVLPSDQYTPATTAAGLTPAEPVEQEQEQEEEEVQAEEETVDSDTADILTYPGNQAMPAAYDDGVDPAAAVPGAAMEILSNIDQCLSACATNLAALQRIGTEQSEALENLSDTLRNQTLAEIGLNLNSLTESLSAALEPMKAVGELVPAIDQLVALIEAREGGRDEKVTPDQLVTNLADQLSTGTIDPWTFKCAYTAVFPADHPADLLRRLVELLGTQRLSGDLFRSAYEAVQAAEPPPRWSGGKTSRPESAPAGDAERGEPVVQMVQDEEMKSQLDEARRLNEELKRSLEEREDEFEQLLAAKEQETQELLNSRYEEFNSRYEEVADLLNKKEEEYLALLENKDTSITEKETEAKLLRDQMEELRSQTEEMVKELQKQMTDIKISKADPSPPKPPEMPPAPAAGSFFDSMPGQNKGAGSLFDAVPENKPLFQEQTATQPVPVVQPVAPQPVTAPQPVAVQPVAPQPIAPQPLSPQPVQPAMTPQPAAPQPVSPQPVAAQGGGSNTGSMLRQAPSPTQPFAAGAGSYGSGVRAQVFEVIVRQALAGAPWREICAGPMQVNNITPDEVEAEVKRRQAMLNK